MLILSLYLRLSWCRHLSRRPLPGKTKGRGWTCWGRTRRCRDCLYRKNTSLHYCQTDSELCLFYASRQRQNHMQFQRCWKNKAGRRANKHPYNNCSLSDRHSLFIRGYKYDKMGHRWSRSQSAMRSRDKRSRHANICSPLWYFAWWHEGKMANNDI